ncbi:MAG: hypothetical protein U1A78_41390 [Polyangia bacterium]
MTSLAREFALTPSQARAAFGAVRTVAEAGGGPGPRAVQLLEVAVAALELGGDWRAIPAASPAEVGAAFPSAAARRVLADALLIPACIEGEVTAAGQASVESFAAALRAQSPFVRLLGAMRRRHAFPIKQAIYRRSPDARRMLARTWAEEGIRGMWWALQFIMGIHVHVNPSLAARYHALGKLPQGTLGRRFHDDFVARGLPFPGERGALPERMIHHDLMHVINSYGTDPAGECELAGFYAAFTSGEPFTFIVIVLTTFHLGLPVSPAFVRPARGALDPARVMAAFLRGRRLRVDVMGPWDHWSLMPLTTEETRARLGIGEPVTSAPAMVTASVDSASAR